MIPLLRVPEQPPTLPGGSRQALNVFQPAPGFLKYMQFWFWIILFLTDIGLTVAYIVGSIALIVEGLWWVAVLLFPVAFVIIVLPDIIAYIAIHMRFDTTWYAMTDRAMRLRRGIWVIHETTISFENIQNVKLQQGPLQRWCGISNVIVETAGAGGSSQGKHGRFSVSNQGIIEGVADAERLRDLILNRLRQARGAGLGDEETKDARARDRAAGGAGLTPAHVAVLREIRDLLVA
jgi:membrane protein YdbS with pleckstrin-like domain